MPWNQSVKKETPPSLKSKKLMRVVVLMSSLMILITAFLLVNRQHQEDDSSENMPVIKKRKTDNITHHYRQKHSSKKKTINTSSENRLLWIEKKYGTNIPESLKTTVYFLKNPPKQVFRPPPRKEEIFKHKSEQSIASVLLMKPGAFILQRSIYDESFDHDFKRSLQEPTIILDSDTPQERELKQAVNEIKAELSERMRAGEKPSEIMTATMNDAYELSKYSQSLQSLIHEIEDDPTKSDKDVEDFVNAANKMLRDNGAQEIAMPSMFRRQLRLKMLARKKLSQEEDDK